MVQRVRRVHNVNTCLSDLTLSEAEIAVVGRLFLSQPKNRRSIEMAVRLDSQAFPFPSMLFRLPLPLSHVYGYHRERRR